MKPLPPAPRLYRARRRSAGVLLITGSLVWAACSGGVEASKEVEIQATPDPEEATVETTPVATQGGEQDQGPPQAETQDAGIELPPVRFQVTDDMDPAVAAFLTQCVANVEKAPSSIDAHAELALAYEANTLFREARLGYENLAKLAPDDAQWRFRLAVMQHADGDLVSALETLKQVATEITRTPVIHARLGDMYLEMGMIDEAGEAWQQAIAVEPESKPPIQWPQSRVGLAQVKLFQEEYEEAARLCQEALALNPQYRSAHYTLGLAYSELGRDEEAKVAFQRGKDGYKEFPGDPHRQRLDALAKGILRRLGVVENALASGAAQQALQLAQPILSERPNDPLVINLVARAHSAMGRFDLAYPELVRSEGVDPENYQTKIELVVCLLNRPKQTPEAQAADMQAALEKAQEAVQIAPMIGRTYYFLGLVQFMAAGQDPQALQGALGSFNAAVARGCQEPQLYEYLARLYATMGRNEDMIKYAELGSDSAPDNPAAHIFLCQAYSTAQRFDDALAALEKARVSAGNNMQILQTIAGFETQVKQMILQKKQEENAKDGAEEGDGSDGE